jgi:hypothetical protein
MGNGEVLEKDFGRRTQVKNSGGDRGSGSLGLVSIVFRFRFP